MTDVESWKALKCSTFREKEEGEFASVLPARIFPLGLKAPKFSAGSACRPLWPVGPSCGYGPDFSMNTATTRGLCFELFGPSGQYPPWPLCPCTSRLREEFLPAKFGGLPLGRSAGVAGAVPKTLFSRPPATPSTSGAILSQTPSYHHRCCKTGDHLLLRCEQSCTHGE